MTTRQEYREQVRRHIGDDRVPTDQLAGDIASGDTSITMLSGVNAGAPQLFEIDRELIYSDVFGGTTFSSCLRGFAGTIPAAHTSGTKVRLGPRWSAVDVDDAINAAINRMSALGLYQMKTVDVTWDDTIQGYNLASDLIDVYEVRAKISGTSALWPEVDAYDVVHDLDSAEFASTKAAIFYEGGEVGLPLRVRYRAAYGLFTDDSDDSSTLGIQSFAAELPAVGAAVELMAGEEAKRTQIHTAIESQRGVDVPPRANLGAWQALDARFRQRCEEALARLDRLYPPRLVRRP